MSDTIAQNRPVERDASAVKPVRLFCVALDRYPPFRVDVIELMDKALTQRGYSVDWAMWRDQPGAGGTKRTAQGRVFVLGRGSSRQGLVGRLENMAAWLPYVVRVVEQIFRGRYDVVQARDIPVFASIVLLAARLARSRFVYWMSYPMAESRRFRAADPAESLSALKRRLLSVFGGLSEWLQYRFVLPGADHVFVQSDRMRQDVMARGIAAHKLTAVPMGVLSDDLPPTDEVDPWLGQAAIVHLGTLIRVRRPEFLIDVLGHVCAERPDALLVFIGDAPEPDMTFLRTYAQQAGLSERIVFTGALPRARALALCRHARVCVSTFPPHPLNDSTTPTKLIEYLALARPVVVNDHPDQSVVVRESGAGLIAPFEARAFAEAVLTLLRDRPGAERMAARGPAYVARARAYPILAVRVDAAYRALLR